MPKTTTISLTKNQQHLLLLIFKFRYITADLIAKHRKVNNWAINSTLQLLMSKQLITRRYESNYRLQGKSARYFLTSLGSKYLQTNLDYTDTPARLRSRDAVLSDAFIDKHIAILELYVAIHRLHADVYTAWTKYELAADSDPYPKKLPDMVVEPNNGTMSTRSYFIEFFDQEPLFAVKQRIQQYISHYDTSPYTKATYPVVVLVLSRPLIAKKITAYVDSLFEDVEFAATSPEQALSVIAE
jgi:hypothetical protein